MAALHSNTSRRPSAAASKLPSAPTVLTMNDHFARPGQTMTAEQYDHGIQVIDEDKEFKYACDSFESNFLVLSLTVLAHTVRI